MRECSFIIEHNFTKEEIIKALECCQVDADVGCEKCPYYNESANGVDCVSKLCADALRLIKAGE